MLVEDLADFYKVCGFDAGFSFEYLFDSPQDLSDLERAEFENTRVHAVPEHDGPVDWEELLLPSQRSRLERYNDLHRHRLSNGRTFSDEFVTYDLDHEPCKRARLSKTGGVCTGNQGCLISHGCIWSPGKKCWLQASGWARAHVYPVTAAEFQCVEFPLDIAKLLRSETLSSAEVKSMIGNGWHLRSMGLFLMYLLGSIQPRETLKLMRITAFVPGQHDGDSDGDNEGVIEKDREDVFNEQISEIPCIELDSQ